VGGALIFRKESVGIKHECAVHETNPEIFHLARIRLTFMGLQKQFQYISCLKKLTLV